MKQKKVIAITGCSGFIAHHTIKEAQKQGWYVVGVDKRPIPVGHSQPDEFIQTDVFDLKYLDLQNIDAVIHLAWRANIGDCIRHPETSAIDNINMTLHLLEVCREVKIEKFVFPSTASLYSHNPTPWTEDMVVEPIEPYSWHKLACEHLCEMYSKQYGVPSVVLRFFQVFGELQREDTVIAVFKRLIKAGKTLTLTKNKKDEKKSSQRDFIYAGDIAKAIMLAVKANASKGEVFNICSGKLTSIEEIAKTMGGKIGWIPTRPFDVNIHHGDTKLAQSELGFKYETDVIDWLKK